MGGVVAAVVLAAVFAAVMAGLLGLGRRVRRRGSAGGQAFVGRSNRCGIRPRTGPGW